MIIEGAVKDKRYLTIEDIEQGEVFKFIYIKDIYIMTSHGIVNLYDGEFYDFDTLPKGIEDTTPVERVNAKVVIK